MKQPSPCHPPSPSTGLLHTYRYLPIAKPYSGFILASTAASTLTSRRTTESAIPTSARATGRESWRTSSRLLEKISHLKGFPLLFLNGLILLSAPPQVYNQFSLLQPPSHLQFGHVPESTRALLARRGRGSCPVPQPSPNITLLLLIEGCSDSLVSVPAELPLTHRLREAAGSRSRKAVSL